MGKIVAVLGASIHKERFASRAIKLLLSKGHTVLPVNPIYDNVDGLHCYKSLTDLNRVIDTITVYVNPERALAYSSEIIAAKPKRVILNPGAENSRLDKLLTEAGITVVHGCTLVMLDTEKF